MAKDGRMLWACLAVVWAAGGSGCQWVPRSQLTSFESQNRILSEQSRTQLEELATLKGHLRDLERKVIQAEEELAQVQSRWRDDRAQLLAAGLEPGAEMPAGINPLVASRVAVPISRTSPLRELAREQGLLRFDAATGSAQLDAEILFDSGQAELPLGAQRALEELVAVLGAAPESPYKLLIVGHTDDRPVTRRPGGQQYLDNWHLSAQRAVAVARYLQQAGVPAERLAVAALGGASPLVPNDDARQRRFNRRVEVFVLDSATELPGWVGGRVPRTPG